MAGLHAAEIFRHRNSITLTSERCQSEGTTRSRVSVRLFLPDFARVKELSNKSHIDIEGCLRRARKAVFWPSMNQEQRAYISKCGTWRCYLETLQKQPMVVMPFPDRPWQRLAVDFFQADGAITWCFPITFRTLSMLNQLGLMSESYPN